jgi:KDO2-lipid IV(A) lauroyltransferase
MHWLSYLLFVGFYRIVVALPQGWVEPIAGALARLTVALGLAKRTVLRNLEIAFGERMSAGERQQLYRDNIRTTWLTVLELMWMTKHDRDWVRQRARIFGWEHVERAREQGRGALMLGGHFGNSELQNAVMALAGDGLYHSYTGKQRNPYLEKFVMRLRTDAGVRAVGRSPEAPRRMIQILKDNQLMGICADLNTRKGRAPIFVPFFGKLASVPEGMATLGVKTGCPVLFSWITRTGPFEHEIFIKPLHYARTGNLKTDREALARCFLEALEAVIRERPVDYLWLHKRYRTRPPGDPASIY